MDSTICETYGLQQEGALHHGYTGARGYHPLLAVAAGTGDVLMARLRAGNANTARGAAHFLTETIGRVREAGARLDEKAGHQPGSRIIRCSKTHSQVQNEEMTGMSKFNDSLGGWGGVGSDLRLGLDVGDRQSRWAAMNLGTGEVREGVMATTPEGMAECFAACRFNLPVRLRTGKIGACNRAVILTERRTWVRGRRRPYYEGHWDEPTCCIASP